MTSPSNQAQHQQHGSQNSIPQMLQVLGSLNVAHVPPVSAGCTQGQQHDTAAAAPPPAHYDNTLLLVPESSHLVQADNTSKRRNMANVDDTTNKRSNHGESDEDGSKSSNDEPTTNPFISDQDQSDSSSAILSKAMRTVDPNVSGIDTAARENTSASKFFQPSSTNQKRASAAAEKKPNPTSPKKKAPKKPTMTTSQTNPPGKRTRHKS